VGRELREPYEKEEYIKKSLFWDFFIAFTGYADFFIAFTGYARLIPAD